MRFCTGCSGWCISGAGPRVGQSGFGLIPGFVYTAPYEEPTLEIA
jgi:peptide/nickel transport system substrate-binding protein